MSDPSPSEERQAEQVLSRSERLEVGVTNAFAGVVTKRRREGVFEPAFLERLAAVQGLVHPNLAMIFSAGPGELTLEWVEGVSLAQLRELARRRGLRGVPAPFEVQLVIELCKVVSAVQRLSPGSHPSLTAGHVLLGRARATVKWSLAGACELPATAEPRDDVQALGLLLAGCGAGVDEALRSTIAACLEPEPERRYQSPAELQQVLQAWLTGHPSPLLVELIRYAETGEGSASTLEWLQAYRGSDARAPSKPARRLGAILLAGTLVACGLLGALGLMRLETFEGPPPKPQPPPPAEVLVRPTPAVVPAARPVVEAPALPQPPAVPVLREVDGPGAYELSAAHALRFEVEGATLSAPDGASWTVGLLPASGGSSIFASFFARDGALLKTFLVDAREPATAPPGAVSARLFYLHQANLFRGGRLHLEARIKGLPAIHLEKERTSELGVEPRDHSLTIHLRPNEPYHLAASGQDLLVLLTQGATRYEPLRTDSRAVLQPSGSQVLVRSGAGFTFAGASGAVVTVVSALGPGAASSGQVLVSKASPAQRASLHAAAPFFGR